MNDRDGVDWPPPASPSEMAAAWRHANAALHDSERRYRELVENSLGLICTHDLAGTILSVNPAAAKSLGYRPEEGVGRSLREFLAPEKRHLFDEYLRRMAEHGRDAGVMSLVARSGDVRYWMYRNVLTRRMEGTPYVLGHAIDITDRVTAERALREREEALRTAHAELEARVRERTLELERANERLHIEMAERQAAERAVERALRQAQEANHLKDEFLGTLSHELRTPLNAIFGWARILGARRLEADTAHGVEVIARNAEAQIRLIDEVLDVSRIIAGKMSLSLERADLAAILRGSVDAIRPLAEAKGIQLHERIGDLVVPVFADPLRLQQVFGNVLSNSLKFTAKGGTIAIVLHVRETIVDVAIADTGVGIRREVLPFVFERFRQADSSITRTHGGLGLGLAIARHIVVLHGGSVKATSAGEGHGATLTIQLPCACGDSESPSGPVPPVAAAVAASGVPLSRRTLIVVEDDPDARELISEVLREAGARVIAVASTAEGLAEAKDTKPDLLLTDLGLPIQDGFELLEKIRALYPGLPAIALTAYARTTDKERAIAAGFQRYVVKPVDPRTLVKIVESML